MDLRIRRFGRVLSFEDGDDWSHVTIGNGRLNIVGYILIPMGNDKFMIENGDEQVQFSRNIDGEISELVVMFRNGSSRPFKRLDE